MPSLSCRCRSCRVQGFSDKPYRYLFKRCPIDVYLEGDVGRLGEDLGPRLLVAAGQRTLLCIGSCSVSYEMLQSWQTAAQVTTNIFQAAVEVLVLLQCTMPLFPHSCKSGLGRGHSKDSSPDWLHQWAWSGGGVLCLPLTLEAGRRYSVHPWGTTPMSKALPGVWQAQDPRTRQLARQHYCTHALGTVCKWSML